MVRSKSFGFYSLWFCAVFLVAQGIAYGGFRAADRYDLLPRVDWIYITPLVTFLAALCWAAYVMAQKFVAKETRKPTDRESWALAALAGLSANLLFILIMMAVTIIEVRILPRSRDFFSDFEELIALVAALTVVSVIVMLPVRAVLWFCTRNAYTIGDQDITDRFS